MDDTDPIADRLRDLGRQPVEPAVASRHLSAMAAAPSGSSRSRTRLKIGAAFLVGLLVGGTGLASAGALPGPAQDAAHTTLSKVGVKVPQGTERFNDPAVCGTDPATQQPFRNHGQYVKAHKGDPAASQSRCGKPLKAGTEPDEKQTDPATDPAAGGSDQGGTADSTPKAGNGKGKGKPAKAKAQSGDADGKSTDPTTEPEGTAPSSPGKSDERGPSTSKGPTTSSSTSTSAPVTNPQP